MMTAMFCGWMKCDNIVLKKVRKRIEIERISKNVYGVFHIVGDEINFMSLLTSRCRNY